MYFKKIISRAFDLLSRRAAQVDHHNNIFGDGYTIEYNGYTFVDM